MRRWEAGRVSVGACMWVWMWPLASATCRRTMRCHRYLPSHRTPPASAPCCARWPRTSRRRACWTSRPLEVCGAGWRQTRHAACGTTCGCPACGRPRLKRPTQHCLCLCTPRPPCPLRPHRGASGAVAQEPVHRGRRPVPPAHAARHPLAAPGVAAAAALLRACARHCALHRLASTSPVLPKRLRLPSPNQHRCCTARWWRSCSS